MQGAVATDDKIKQRGILMASRCCACQEQEESLDHILWECYKAQQLWDWVFDLFGVRTQHFH
ncbi:hypothetical protein FRX31_016731, partial [Thalictrum thalictroides]